MEQVEAFTQSFDARDWAQAWCRIAREIEAAKDGREVIDEGWMMSWFANAIMRGYDEYPRRNSAAQPSSSRAPQNIMAIVRAMEQQADGQAASGRDDVALHLRRFAAELRASRAPEPVDTLIAKWKAIVGRHLEDSSGVPDEESALAQQAAWFVQDLTAFQASSRAPEPDVVCQHGTAMDVHCCHCHSGFIFDRHHECPEVPPDALKEIAVMAMTAQSDPHASAEVYRKALIDICNYALAASPAPEGK